MDIDKELKRSADRLNASLADEAVPPTPRPPRRPRFATAIAAAALAFGVVGVAYIATNRNGAEVASDTTTTATTEPVAPLGEPYDPGYIQSWSMEYGPDWNRAEGGDLMPVLGGESITFATFPLRPGGDRCAHMPENALRDLGPEDALISVFLGWAGSGEPWPNQGFDDTVFPATPGTDAQECAERPDLEVHWGPWFNGEGHHVLVVFGGEVTPDRRAETWAVLSSLQPEPDVPTAVDRGICVATRPPVPGLVPPDRWNPTPSDPDSVWYGTPDLWVPLRTDGMYQERKSVWWSQNFTNAARESSPAIAVRYDRIDRQVASVVVVDPGTNASTAQDGLFMIANIEYEPPTPGCWTVTGEYKGATLSYVINVP